MDIDEIYAHHPLTRRAILARVERQRTRPPITEWHLAIDTETALTDQNHFGGVQAVIELGVAADISSKSVVLDIGAGLGGSARVLASAFDCAVIGVERDPARYADAIALTRAVRLHDRVSFVHVDALTEVPRFRRVDVLWGQAAWVHFPALDLFLKRWVSSLRPSGRIAMADAYLRRRPRTASEFRLLRSLEASWAAHLLTFTEWRHAIRAVGFEVVHRQDCTGEAVLDVDRLLNASRGWPHGTLPASERSGWRQARRAFRSGLVGSLRVVAHRRVARP